MLNMCKDLKLSTYKREEYLENTIKQEGRASTCTISYDFRSFCHNIIFQKFLKYKFEINQRYSPKELFINGL